MRRWLLVLSLILLLAGCEKKDLNLKESNLKPNNIKKNIPKLPKEKEPENMIEEIKLLNISEDILDKNRERFSKVTNLLKSDAKKGLPGAVLLVAQKGDVIYYDAFGDRVSFDLKEELDIKLKMNKETIFDLASLTKSFGATLAIMDLEKKNLLNSKDRVSKYLNSFNTNDKKDITIENLLTHTSGLRASFPFYKQNKEGVDTYYSIDSENTLKQIGKLNLKYKIGEDTIYSDLGFISIGKIVEKVSKLTLDEYLEKNCYKELNLKNTIYNPLLKGFDKSNFAATERMGNTRDGKYLWDGVRKHTLIGEAHDELCFYSMNGVSGHAGLFSNALEIAKISEMLLQNYKGKDIFLNNETVKKYTKKSILCSRYTLGFDYAKDKRNIYRYGKYVSDKAFGKTGWTGTMALIDPEYDLVIVLLTNKRHSPCEGEKFEGAQLDTGKYYKVSEMIYKAILGDD